MDAESMVLRMYCIQLYYTLQTHTEQAGAIITTRFIMIIAANIISMDGVDPVYQAMPCDKLNSFYDTTSELLDAHPICASLSARSSVKADMNGTVDEVAAALNLAFSMAVWLALAIHAIGIEIYVSNRTSDIVFESLMTDHTSCD
jgi:hypothetical protein